MQVNPKKGYTMFLQSWCGYACDDQERSTFHPEAAFAKEIFQLLDVRVNAADNETRIAGPARGSGNPNLTPVIRWQYVVCGLDAARRLRLPLGSTVNAPTSDHLVP
jgi:hypothetical protein